jgi:hypothetical protein
MPPLEEYLLSSYPEIATQLHDIELYVLQCSTLLATACYMPKKIGAGKTRRAKAYWPYSFPNHDGVKDRVSVSTQGMCAAAVDKLIESEFGQSVQMASLESYRDSVVADACAQIEADLSDAKPAWESRTFGPEDVFTASWLIEVMSKRAAPVKAMTATVRVIRTALEQAIKDQFEKTLFMKPNEAGPHPLPLLRTLQAMDTIEKTDHLRKLDTGTKRLLTKENLFSAAHWFERNLHRQMSFYRSSDFRFDAAEMIFCLSGALQTGATTAYDNVIVQVLQIVKDAQERSVYWRPYRPMISTETGLTLLPLSIEVATTLLHVLDVAANFELHQSTLTTYYRWLVSQRIVEDQHNPDSPARWAGWHSENAYDSTRVHVWDTARVGMFLLQYRDAIKKQIQKDLRQRSGFFGRHCAL